MPLRVADAIFWIACACCITAQAAIVRSVVISPASRPASQGDTRRSGISPARRAAEIAWAVIPGIALAIVLVYTWTAMHGTPVTVITGAA